ncbi:MAG: hypothetical protein Roseis2KO_38020 [Roseivirga sp.]
MEHSPKIEFYKKREFSDTLNSTFMFIRENGWPYLKVQLLIAGPVLLIVNILTNQLQMGFMNPFEMAQSDDFFTDMIRIYGMVFIASMITGSLVPTISYGYMRAYQTTAPENITTAQVTKGFGKRFFSLFIFGIISTIVILISAVFLFLPAIYFAVVLSMGASIIVFEDADPLKAFSRCFTVIKDNFFNTLLLVIVVGLIAYFVSALFSLPQGIMYGIWTFSNLESGSTAEMPSYMQALSIVFSVFQSFGNIVTYSLLYVALAYQYSNLIERRESRGLMSRIGEMDKEQQEDEDEVY